MSATAPVLDEPTVDLLLCDHGTLGLDDWLARNERTTSGTFRRDQHLRDAARRAHFIRERQR